MSQKHKEIFKWIKYQINIIGNLCLYPSLTLQTIRDASLKINEKESEIYFSEEWCYKNHPEELEKVCQFLREKKIILIINRKPTPAVMFFIGEESEKQAAIIIGALNKAQNNEEK